VKHFRLTWREGSAEGRPWRGGQLAVIDQNRNQFKRMGDLSQWDYAEACGVPKELRESWKSDARADAYSDAERLDPDAVAKLGAIPVAFSNTLDEAAADTVETAYKMFKAKFPTNQERRLAKRTTVADWGGSELGLPQVIDQQGIPFRRQSKREKCVNEITLVQGLAAHSSDCHSLESGSFAWNAAALKYLNERFTAAGYKVRIVGCAMHNLDYNRTPSTSKMVMQTVLVKDGHEKITAPELVKYVGMGETYSGGFWTARNAVFGGTAKKGGGVLQGQYLQSQARRDDLLAQMRFSKHIGDRKVAILPISMSENNAYQAVEDILSQLTSR